MISDQRLRSWLFMPADNPPMLAKIGSLAADCYVADLEDALAPPNKAEAAESLGASIDRLAQHAEAGRLWVRINGLYPPDVYYAASYYQPRGLADLDATVRPGLGGVILPKVESADVVSEACEEITRLEKKSGLLPGSVRVITLLETPQAFVELKGICTRLRAIERVVGVMLGSGSYRVATNSLWTDDEDELIGIRSDLVRHASLVRLGHIIDGPVADLLDTSTFARSSERARAMGYTGKLCVHPRQVSIANASFTPTSEEYAAAHGLITAFEQAQEHGKGVTAFSGRLVERPMAEQQRRLLRDPSP